MHRLNAADLAAFARRYRFAGGRLRSVRLRYGKGTDFAAEFVVTAHAAVKELGMEPARIRLRFRLEGVEEFRFQKRPSGTAGNVSEARLGYFNGLFYVNLDAWGLAPGDVPKLHDYRGSDTYLAGTDLYWEEVKPKAE